MKTMEQKKPYHELESCKCLIKKWCPCTKVTPFITKHLFTKWKEKTTHYKLKVTHQHFSVIVSSLNPPVLDLLIKTYVKARLIDPAFDVIRYIDELGFCIGLSSFNSFLHVAQRCNQFVLFGRFMVT